jgi:glutathione S-transferase
MKLHWSPRSPFVRKVMIAAHELGVADRIETVRTMVAMTKPNAALLADNPIGKIPTLILDDGTAVFDSLVICEYLDSLAGPKLFPTGAARWAALTRHALAQGLLDALILWRNERDKPEARQTPEWLAAFALKTTATLDRFEATLSEAGGPSGDAFGIAEITMGCALSYLDFRFPDLDWRSGRDRLAAWHAGFEARPSVKATRVVDA